VAVVAAIIALTAEPSAIPVTAQPGISISHTATDTAITTRLTVVGCTEIVWINQIAAVIVSSKSRVRKACYPGASSSNRYSTFRYPADKGASWQYAWFCKVIFELTKPSYVLAPFRK
jgi:hypothetical protein